MWYTVLLCKNITYLCFSIPQLFLAKIFLLRPCCGSSCSVHPTVVYVHTPKKSISQYQQFSSNITKWKQGIVVFGSKLRDILAYTAGKNKMIWFRPSVGETCPCTSVQHGATETVSTDLIFWFLMSSAGFESEGPSSGKQLYLQVWYDTFYMFRYKHTKQYLYIHCSSWRWTLGFETCRRYKKLQKFKILI